MTPEQKARRAEYNRKWYADNPEYRARKAEYYRKPDVRARQSEYDRKRLYGLTPAQHKAMLEAQSGLCAICRGKGGKNGLVVDHCHETGIVRGLLCGECNSGIGKLGDSPARLTAAVKYLRDTRKRQQLPLALDDYG